MRWPFRRASHATAPAPAASPRRARGEWVLVPPMPTTVAADAPLVTGPAPVQPPLPGRTAVIRSQVPPPVGRVEGIARALPLPATRPATEPLPQRPKVRKARPVGQLTEATDDYVGPAREPAEPYRAPGWMRYVPEWMQQTTSEPDPGPPTLIPADRPLSIPSNIPANPRIPTPEPVLPPRVAEIVRSAEPPPPARRRPSLGQTRRLGLGSPVSRPADEPFVPPAEPPTVVEAAPEEPPPPAPAPSPPPAPTPPSPEPPPAPPPLVYRAGGEPLPRVTGRIVRDEVPPDLAGTLKRDRGADVSAVPVFRGPAVDAEARSRGARAFAKDGAVFLPDSAGPTGSAKAKALLAHELVHVVQQRTLGSLPAPSTPEGRRLEAEAVAAEGQYGGLADTPLIHPPRPRVVEPSLAGPAQLADPVVTPPDPAHSHFEREAREEIDQIAESTAHRVLEEWTPPAAQGGPERRASSGPRMTSGLPTTVGGAFGDTVGFTERRGADATSPTSSRFTGGGRSGTFDRAARRQEMETELLDALNAEQAEQGGSLISHLSDADLERIERALDREEQGGGRGSPTTPRPINPEEGGAFGDTVSFTQRSGADLVDPRARQTAQTGQTAQSAASRLSLAAALSASTDSARATPSRTTPGAGEQLSDAGGTFGDTVSFSEPTGDDRFRGGRRPDAAASSPGRAGAADMHGSEEEPVDLDRVDMEDLTARLYDRVRSRLRLELLVDRERSGQLTDFR